METPLYAQPEAWSVAIALLALILSQLPPLTQLFRRLKVSIAAPEFIARPPVWGTFKRSS